MSLETINDLFALYSNAQVLLYECDKNTMSRCGVVREVKSPGYGGERIASIAVLMYYMYISS
jgi:hypothetical protein